MNSENQERKMLESISNELGSPNLLEILSTVPMRRLLPILLHAFKRRAETRSPTDLLRAYENKQEFLGVSTAPQDELFRFALICHDAVQTEFKSVQTSPIAPLGLNAVLSMVSQHNTLSSIRETEVVSDLTTQLALECALRRKKKAAVNDDGDVHLSTSGRVLRLQPFDKDKGYMQHFNLFALCSGGRNKPSEGGFAVPVMRMHVETLLRVISNLDRNGYKSGSVVVKISDMRFLDQLIAGLDLPREEILRNSLNDEFDMFDKYQIPFPKEVEHARDLTQLMFSKCQLDDRVPYLSRIEGGIIEPLRALYPLVRFCFDFNRKAGLGYYPHLCFHIFASNQDGNMIQLADGGAVDWAANLLGNRKEAMVTSGIGSELMQKLFGPT